LILILPQEKEEDEEEAAE